MGKNRTIKLVIMKTSIVSKMQAEVRKVQLIYDQLNIIENQFTEVAVAVLPSTQL